ncbi:thiolase family protein [Amycolatopsis pithecellobii]|uniref:propanoyl-CoA C-acyltransferase n=1 Tax=Amycolatopsis pithecellobii TaxID=664692 RepID=A0A6N7Z1V9_9PSEU|nr:thiolase family protein [Amycolatopsis pithecellobii]MTD55473.1 thiolase family protein [Amycolatopsis pithecellobii]
MRDVNIVGVGMTRFGKFPDATMAGLSRAAVTAALADADVAPAAVGVIVHGNSLEGAMTGQHSMRGQVALGGPDFGTTPVINIENACGSSSSAFHVALGLIRSGQYDTAVVAGSEKLSGRSTREVLDAMLSGTDLTRVPEIAKELTGSDEPPESFYMAMYSWVTRQYMARSGATKEDFADVAVKNSAAGALNPNAQYRKALTREQILEGRVIADPLTVTMCAPIADGAAAVVLQAADVSPARPDAVRVRASVLRSGVPGGGDTSPEVEASRAAYEIAGVGPEDLDVVEVHDAASSKEMIMYEKLGLCGPGDGAKLLASGTVALGGRVPVNPSGGLVSRGHPVGATGCAQLFELVTQLRGRAGERQVEGARIALAENSGGYVHPDPGICVVTILGKDAA